MPYPEPFHRLVVIGGLYADVYNFSMSIVPIPGSGTLALGLVTPDLLEDVAAAVDTWFRAAPPTGIGFTNDVTLTGVKLNRIGTDGRYTENETMFHEYPAPAVGTVNASIPPQNAVAITLATAIERGRASKGRFYPPPFGNQEILQSDGRLLAATATTIATAAGNLVEAVNAVYAALPSSDAKVGAVGVASDAGAGAFQVCTRIKVGRVVDTIRSRRSALPEEHVEVPVV